MSTRNEEIRLATRNSVLCDNRQTQLFCLLPVDGRTVYFMKALEPALTFIQISLYLEKLEQKFYSVSSPPFSCMIFIGILYSTSKIFLIQWLSLVDQHGNQCALGWRIELCHFTRVFKESTHNVINELLCIRHYYNLQTYLLTSEMVRLLHHSETHKTMNKYVFTSKNILYHAYYNDY